MAALLLQPVLPGLAQGPGYDPLLRDEVLFLGPGGVIVPEPPEEAMVPAPTSLPGQPGAAVWAHEVPFDGALAGDVLVRVVVRVGLAVVPVPPDAPALHLALLHAGAPVAEATGALALAGPGEYVETFTLPAQGLPVMAGDGLGLALTLRSPNAEAVPAVSYALGPEGSGLRLRLRAASLDALGHAHAPTDLHHVLAAYRPVLGDLGGGRWAMDLSLGTGVAAQPYPLRVPANATRVVMQLYLEPEQDRDPEAPARMDLELPGGPMTVHRGEVVVREVAFREGAEVRCLACGPSGQAVAIARFELALAPGAPAPGAGEPLAPTGGGRPGAGLAPARAPAEGEDFHYVLVMAVPAGLMLLASIGFVLRDEGRASARAPTQAPARAPAHAPARAPARASARTPPAPATARMARVRRGSPP